MHAHMPPPPPHTHAHTLFPVCACYCYCNCLFPLQAVSSGVEHVFGSAATLSAAFGLAGGVGIDLLLLDRVQCDIMELFTR